MLSCRLLCLLLLVPLAGCVVGDDEFERYEQGARSSGAARDEAAAYTRTQALSVTCPEARKAGAFAVSYTRAGAPDEADRLLATVAAYCPDKAADFVRGAEEGIDGLLGDARLAAEFADWLEQQAA